MSRCTSSNTAIARLCCFAIAVSFCCTMRSLLMDSLSWTLIFPLEQSACTVISRRWESSRQSPKREPSWNFPEFCFQTHLEKSSHHSIKASIQSRRTLIGGANRGKRQPRWISCGWLHSAAICKGRVDGATTVQVDGASRQVSWTIGM